MFRVFHICLLKSLRRFLLKSFADSSWEVVYCSFFTCLALHDVRHVALRNQNSCRIPARHPINTSGNCVAHCSWDWRCNISDRPTWLAEVVSVDFPSRIGGQRVFETGDRHRCNILEQSFLEENPQRMAKCTTNKNLTISNLLTSTKIGTNLENVVECLPICKVSGGDGVEVFQTTPPREYCHSTGNIVHELNGV